MEQDRISVASFEEAALLRASGFRYLGSTCPGRRVCLYFEDKNGKASAMLQEHCNKGVPVNSRSYADGLAWAKNIIFAARDQVVA